MIEGRVHKYLDKEEEWRKLVDYINSSGTTELGLDSEFYGVDLPGGESCVGRSQVHVWSVALFDGGYSPRGYRTARGYTLPVEALGHFRGILSSQNLLKYAHNSNVDVHSIHNTSGIDCVGIVNTLSLVRWVVPGRLKYGLDVICQELLGFGKLSTFEEICSVPSFVDVVRKRCSCGVEGCRKRKGHTKSEEVVSVESDTKRTPIPLESIVPGHKKFLDLIDYAAQDPIGSLCLGDYCNALAKEQEIYIPWIKQ